MAKPCTLLVVDDNEMNRDMLSRRLERKGYGVRLAGDGEEALAIVGTEVVDLLLLDVMMPGISGIEVLRTLRQSHTQAELPVIMVTARSGSDEVVEALALGANDYVTKPIDFPVVLARIESHLRGREQALRLRESAGEPAAADLGPGVTIAGKYRLEARIGSGNFGTIFRARHLALDADVALKVLHPGLSADARMRERFQREGVSACRIQHPNAVAVLDFGVTGRGVAYLAMELLSGESLAAELVRQGPLAAGRAAEVMLPVLEALAAAHEAGVVHRDLKPQNVFLHRTGRGETVKVLDFGLARLVGCGLVEESLTVEGWILGTPAYMAPERFRGGDCDGRSDVYGAGVMLFQMLTGKLPYAARGGDPMAVASLHAGAEIPSVRALRPEVPAEVEDAVRRALAKDPADRPTAAELARRLATSIGRELPADRPEPARLPIGGAGLEGAAPTVILAPSGEAPAWADDSQEKTRIWTTERSRGSLLTPKGGSR